MLRRFRLLAIGSAVLVAAGVTVLGAMRFADAATTTYEAESAALSGGAAVATDHSGYTGTGFVGGYTDANKGSAATTFTVPGTGSRQLTLRYANGTTATMTLSLYVNGSRLSQISLAPTANWDSWATRTDTVTLPNATNTVAYRFDSTDSGNVNLDNLTVAGATTSPSPSPSASATPPTGVAELETAFLSGGAVAASSITGYGGTGYATGFTAAGARVIRTVNVAAAGNAAAALRYTNATGAARTLSVYVNGVRTGPVTFAAGSGWQSVTQTLPLRAGLNLIGYQYDAGDSGGVALDSVAVTGATALAARGATLPYAGYEAESGTTNGVVLGPDRAYRTVASESSGRRAVRLDNAGKYVEITLTRPANAIVVRYSIPDNAAGTGLTAPLAVYAGGTKVTDLTLTSAYSWVYGAYPFPNDPSLGGGHRFFDETRLKFAATYAAGTVLRLQNDTATPITIDLVEAEVAAPALTAPANSLDVTAYGATAGSGDDTAAFNAAISAAKTQGKTVWVPAGTFDLTSRLTVSGVTVRGAGVWYSTIRGNNGRGGFFATGGNVQLADVTFAGDVRYRDPDSVVTTDAAMEGNFGTGSLIHNVWVEHAKVGLWANGSTNGLYVAGVRIRDTFADGINVNTFPNPDIANNGVANVRVEQSTFRNTGDDALASWSYATPVTGSAFLFNTAALPMLANTAAIYGGNDNRIEDNLFSDTVTVSAGITISTWHSAQPFGGSTLVQRNTLTRTGGWNENWNSSQGAIWIYAESRDITAPVLIKEVDVVDATYQGILLSWQRTISGITFDHVRVQGAGTYGIDIASPGSGTFNYVTVSGAASGGLNNTTGFTIIRGPGNSGF